MLKNISPLISPDLLKCLAEMGHGDELCIADGNYPCNSMNENVIRLDGQNIPELLEAILFIFPLDNESEFNVILMDNERERKPLVWKKYIEALSSSNERYKVDYLERFTFYKRSRKCYAIIATGEKSLFANIILKKGVV